MKILIIRHAEPDYENNTITEKGWREAKMLAERLDINYYDSDLIQLASEESGINIELFGKIDERKKVSLFKRFNPAYDEKILPPDSDGYVSSDNLFNIQAKIIRDLAEKQNCIIIGRCGDYVLRDNPKAIRIFVCADEDACVNKVVELYGLDADDAKKKIDKIEILDIAPLFGRAILKIHNGEGVGELFEDKKMEF